MKNALFAYLFPLFLLSGCSGSNTGNWSKPDTSAEMAAQDREQCETQSRSSANKGLQSDPIGEINTNGDRVNRVLEVEKQQFDLVGKCMRAKGYNSF